MTQRELCLKVLDLLTFIDGNFSIEKAVNDLYQARLLIEEQGYKTPPLSTIFEKTFENAENQGVLLEREFLEDLYESIILKESSALKSSSFDFSLFVPKNSRVKIEKNRKELQVPDGVAIGFCKALAGGLMCIIPSPGITQTLGTGLIISGIDDMIRHAKDPINDGSQSSWEKNLNHRQQIGSEKMLYIPVRKDRYCAIVSF